MAYSETINYTSGQSFNFDTTLVEVASNTLRLKDLGGGTYSTANPLTTTQHQNTITSLSSFAEVATKPANTEIYYQLVLNGLVYWYNSVNAKWEASDGSFSQSNTASDINTNAADVFTDLALLVPQYLSLRVFLSSTNVNARPELTSNTIGYNWINSNPPVINQCLLFGYLSDLLGNNPIPTSQYPITFLVSCDHAFFNGTRFVLPFTKTVNFDNTGYAEISVIETATPGIKLNFSITYFDGISLTTSKLFNAIVPNQPTLSFSNLAVVYPYNFG